MNAIISLFKSTYIRYTLILFSQHFPKHLFNYRQLIYGTASHSEAGLIFSSYIFCVWLYFEACSLALYRLYKIKLFLCSHNSFTTILMDGTNNNSLLFTKYLLWSQVRVRDSMNEFITTALK